LDQGRYHDQNAEDSPTILTQPFPTTKDNQVGDDTHSLKDNSEGHEEPHGAPHGTEISVVAMTVFSLWKALAGIGEGGAAAVEAVRIVVGGLDQAGMLNRLQWLIRTSENDPTHLFAMIADPFRNDDRGDGERKSCACSTCQRLRRSSLAPLALGEGWDGMG
jgi:hypothetical protein